jgi:TolB-like protein/tetratricopeptide (TPR) repeat protein/DNA-binding winged helix-turn-helix (wHTH) protein
MDADDLQSGFRLGEWLVEPRAARITGDGRSYTLPIPELAILMCLAERHGEGVDRRLLRERAWPGEAATDERLRDAIRSLHEALGDSHSNPRYIVPVARRGYALIAHFEPLVTADAAAPMRADAAAKPVAVSWAARAQALLVELRRRHVFRVVGAYLVGMWIMLQVAETTFEPLRLPGWWMTALTIVTVVGLPIVTALAWSYEITPGGIVLDDGDPRPVRLPKARRAVAPVAVGGVALMALITGFAWWRSIDLPTEPLIAPPDGPPSIAVLPLVDMSPAGGNAYLGDGLSEELSTRLAQVPGLRVAARTSAFEFKDRNLDVRRIGQALGVRNVLEGSVRRDGDALRVTVQLIDAVTGYHLWAGSYDRDWKSVLAVQDDIARSVAEALQVVLSPANAEDAPTQPASAPLPGSVLDVQALDPYLAGLALLRQPGDQSRVREAEALFKQVIELSPQFAGAHAGLCTARLKEFEQSRDPAALAAGEQSCRRALELDPALVDTAKALARLQLAAGEFEQAEGRFRQMIARNPLDADLHIGLGDALSGMAKGDLAELSYRRAAEVEPAYWQAYNALGRYLFQRGRNAEAEPVFRKMVALVPSSALAWSNLGGAQQMQGNFAGALAAYRKSLELEPSPTAYSNLATTQFYLGQFDEAVLNFQRALSLGGHDQSVWANLADALWQVEGRRTDAIAAYRKAIELGEGERQRTADDPMLLAQLGYYYGRVGETATARKYLDEAAASGAGLVYVQYFLARAANDRGDVEGALAAVGKLVSLGYPVELLRSAPEFGGLVRDERFRGLLQKKGSA